MSEDILKSISTKFLGWILGIIAGMMVAGLYGGFKFYSDWVADEKAEEVEYHQDKAIMFDNPEQKQATKTHLRDAVTPLEQRLKVERDIDFQKKVLKKLEHLAKIDTLNADQIYQIKEEVKLIKQNQ